MRQTTPRSPARAALLVWLSLCMAIGDPGPLLAAIPAPEATPTPPAPRAVAGPRPSPLPAGAADPRTFHFGLLGLDGELSLRFQDASIPARGWPLELARCYRSDLTEAGALGPGWSWSYGVRVVRDPASGEPRVHEADGGVSVYLREDDELFLARTGLRDSALRRRDDGSWVRIHRDGRREVFDPAGALIERHDAEGLALTIERAGGVPVRVVDCAGRALRLEHREDRLHRVTDPLGRAVEYRYDARGRLREHRDPLGRITSFTYRAGRLASLGFPGGGGLEVAYDARGRVARLAGPGSLVTDVRFEGDLGGERRELEATVGGGRTLRVTLERSGERVRVRVSAGTSTAFEAEVEPGHASVRRGGGPATVLRLDPAGRILAGGGADGRSRGPEPTARPEPRADGLGVLLPRGPEGHDPRGYPRALWVDGRRWSATWDDGGRLLALVDAQGRARRFEYDDADRLLARQAEDGRRERFERDACDRLVRWVGYDGAVVTYERDPRGLLSAVRDGRRGGERTTYEHDAAGDLVRVVRHGRALELAHDDAGRLARATLPDGTQARYAHDADGRLCGLEADDGTRLRWEYGRDARPRRWSLERAEGGRYSGRRLRDEAAGERWELTSPDGERTERLVPPRERRAGRSQDGSPRQPRRGALGAGGERAGVPEAEASAQPDSRGERAAPVAGRRPGEDLRAGSGSSGSSSGAQAEPRAADSEARAASRPRPDAPVEQDRGSGPRTGDTPDEAPPGPGRERGAPHASGSNARPLPDRDPRPRAEPPADEQGARGERRAAGPSPREEGRPPAPAEERPTPRPDDPTREAPEAEAPRRSDAPPRPDPRHAPVQPRRPREPERPRDPERPRQPEPEPGERERPERERGEHEESAPDRDPPSRPGVFPQPPPDRPDRTDPHPHGDRDPFGRPKPPPSEPAPPSPTPTEPHAGEQVDPPAEPRPPEPRPDGDPGPEFEPLPDRGAGAAFGEHLNVALQPTTPPPTFDAALAEDQDVDRGGASQPPAKPELVQEIEEAIRKYEAAAGGLLGAAGSAVAQGVAGGALGAKSIYDDYQKYKRGEITREQFVSRTVLNVALVLATVAAPFSPAIGVAGLIVGLLWGFGQFFYQYCNPDPTFVVLPETGLWRAGPAVALRCSPRGPPARVTVWLDRPTQVRAYVLSPTGERICDLGARSARPGAVTIAWSGRDDAGRPVPEGEYELVVGDAWAEGRSLGLPATRARVVVDDTPPALALAGAGVEAGRLRARASSSEPATLRWSWERADGAQLLAVSPPAERGELDVTLSGLPSGPGTLRVVAEDDAGNTAERSTALDLPALPPALVEELEVTTSLALAPVERGYARRDRAPWLAGELPEGAEALGEWRWTEGRDPRGARVHLGDGTGPGDGEGPDLHYVLAPEAGWFLGAGEHLVQYVRLDPAAPPRQLALQVYADGLDGGHRASWGEPLLDLEAGAAAFAHTAARPPVGRWLRLKLGAEELGLAGRRIEGLLFACYGGRVEWGATTTSGPRDDGPEVAAADAGAPDAEATAELAVRFVSPAPGPLRVELVGPDGAARVVHDALVAAGPCDLRARVPAATVAAGASLRFTRGAELLERPLAPGAQAALLARIAFPPPEAVVRATVPIFGEAGGAGFERFVVDFRPLDRGEAAPSEWTELARAARPEAASPATIEAAIAAVSGGELRGTVHGNLASFDTGSFAHRFEFQPPAGPPQVTGRVEVRLRVFGADGALAEDRVELVIGEVLSNAHATRIPSPDGGAWLRVAPLSLGVPFSVAALEPAPLPPLPAGLTARSAAYRLHPEGLRFTRPATLELSAPEPDAALFVHEPGRGWRPLAAARAGAWLRAPLSRLARGARVAALHDPRLLALVVDPIAAPPGAPFTLLGRTSAGARVELTTPSGRREVVADQVGRFRFEDVALPADARARLVASDALGRRSDPREVGPRAEAPPPAATSLRTWSAPAEVSEGARVHVRAELGPGAPAAVPLELHGPRGAARWLLRRADEAHEVRFAAPPAGEHTLVLLGERRPLRALPAGEGPPPPLPWPEELGPPVAQTDFRERASGVWEPAADLPGPAAASLLVAGPFELTPTTTLGFAYRLEPDAAAQLLVRRAGRVELIPLAGAAPPPFDGVHVVAAAPLEGEGTWRRAELALGALLPPGPVEALLVGRVAGVGWRERSLSAARGLALDDLWLGPAWPARGVARVRLRAVDPRAAALAWAVDTAPDTIPAAVIEGVPDRLELPPQRAERELLHLRVRDAQGRWGPTLHWPRWSDRTPPEPFDPWPAPGATSGDVRIEVSLRDPAGVDPTSVRFWLDGEPAPPAAVDFDPASGRARLDLGRLPARPRLVEGRRLELAVAAADRHGNAPAAPFTWSFTFSAASLASGGLRPLTLDGGRDPAFSPDGARVAFVAERAGQVDLYELELASGAERRLTDDPAVESSPAYAPGGALAYAREGAVWLREGQAPPRRLLEDAAEPAWRGEELLAIRGGALLACRPGGAPRLLRRAAAGVSLLRPRASGALVTFAQRHYHETVWTLRAGAARPLTPDLTDPALRERDPAPAPDGAWIAYADGGRGRGLWLARADGRERAALLLDAGARRPAWAPSGAALVFDSDRSGLRNLWLLELAPAPEVLAAPQPFAPGRGEPLAITITPRREGELRVAIALAGAPDELLELRPFALARAGEPLTLLWDGRGSEALGASRVDLVLATRLGERTFTSRHPLRVDAAPPRTRLYRADDGREVLLGEPIAPGESLALAAEDGPDGSGVARIEWRLGEGPWSPYAGPFELPEGGRIAARSVDRLGHQEPERWFGAALSAALERSREEPAVAPAAVAPSEGTGQEATPPPGWLALAGLVLAAIGLFLALVAGAVALARSAGAAQEPPAAPLTGSELAPPPAGPGGAAAGPPAGEPPRPGEPSGPPPP